MTFQLSKFSVCSLIHRNSSKKLYCREKNSETIKILPNLSLKIKGLLKMEGIIYSYL